MLTVLPVPTIPIFTCMAPTFLSNDWSCSLEYQTYFQEYLIGMVLWMALQFNATDLLPKIRESAIHWFQTKIGAVLSWYEEIERKSYFFDDWKNIWIRFAY